MNKMKNAYQGMDFDWYTIDNENRIAFFASGGGLLPESILGLEKEDYLEVIAYMRGLREIPGIEIIINPDLDELIGFESLEEKARYLESYILMAKKGLIAFDKTMVMYEFDHNYHLVATPSVQLSIEALSEDVKKVISLTKFTSGFSALRSINSENIG